MKKKIIIGSIIAIAVIVFVAIGISKGGSAAPAFGARTFNVKVAEIAKGEISSYVTANGVTEETSKTEVYFEAPLKITKLLVTQNQMVTKGQKLMEVDMDSLNSQLKKLQLSRDTQVAAMSGKSSQQMIAAARNGLDSAQVAYQEAQKNFESSKALYDANAISKADYDRAQDGLKTARSSLDAAKASYDSAVSGKDVGDKTNDLNLKTLELNIEDMEKQIKRIEESLVSPINGAVAAVNVVEGGYTNNMQAAFTIIGTDNVRVRAYVREYDIKNVQPGQMVKISGDAIDKDKPVNGKVTSVSPIARINRTSSGEEVVIDVLVDVEKGEPALRPGLNVSCDIFTVDKKDILTAPMNIVKEDKDGNKFAIIIDKDKIMREKPIKLGISSDMNVEVLEGLNEGDKAVLDPLPSYKDGSGAKIIENGKK